MGSSECPSASLGAAICLCIIAIYEISTGGENRLVDKFSRNRRWRPINHRGHSLWILRALEAKGMPADLAAQMWGATVYARRLLIRRAYDPSWRWSPAVQAAADRQLTARMQRVNARLAAMAPGRHLSVGTYAQAMAASRRRLAAQTAKAQTPAPPGGTSPLVGVLGIAGLCWIGWSLSA